MTNRVRCTSGILCLTVLLASAVGRAAAQDLKREAKEILGISHAQAIATARSFGARDEADLHSDRGTQLRAETDLREWISADDPPIFVHNNDTGEVPTQVGHMAHHPNHARVLKMRADELGVEAVVFAPQIGIAHPSGESLIGFFRRQLSPSKSD